MEQPHRRGLHAEQRDGLAGKHRVRHHVGHEAPVHVSVRAEDVVVDALEVVQHRALGVEVHRRTHAHVVEPGVIEAEHVVHVRMSEEDGIHAPDAMAQRVLPVVGRAVEQHRARPALGVGELERGADARAPVARVVAGARCAVARDRWSRHSPR